VAAAGGGEELSPPEPARVGRWAGIQQLPQEVANAIAAGEVVENPASVVKELVENSLDAAATRISVDIENGGRDLIRVVDDGQGIPASQLLLALMRHATSKLTAIADLTTISTYGFRGEALASVAAVARVVVVSRESDELAGAMIESGEERLSPVRPVAAAPGTSVEVRELFGNTPARRAFLRTARSESAACLRVVSEAALARPDVRFEVRLGGRKALGTSGQGGLAEAAASVLGRGVASKLVPVERNTGGVLVVGVLGHPSAAHPTRNRLILMVNGRRVQQRSLTAAVEAAYRGLLEVGRHPLAILDIRCDPGLVDVNVHPTKREVRFRDEGAIFEAVQRACWGALRELGPAALAVPTTRGADLPADSRWSGLTAPTNFRVGQSSPLLAEQLPKPDGADALSGAARWRYLGQAHNRYLVVETETGLGLLDQHAAHEKVLYARVLADFESGAESQPSPSQGLLTPILLEVAPELVAGLAGAHALLERAGFDLELFGAATLRCSAVPLGTRLSELDRLLEEVLPEPPDGGTGEAFRRHRLAASVACHSALRFGDEVTREEAEALLRDLSQTPGGITCPHGRPALLMLSGAELLSAFRRR